MLLSVLLSSSAPGRIVKRYCVGADVPDFGESEGDDLARIRRIGQDLLVSGHGGVEAYFSEGLAEGAEARHPEDRAVLQDQQGFPG